MGKAEEVMFFGLGSEKFNRKIREMMGRFLFNFTEQYKYDLLHTSTNKQKNIQKTRQGYNRRRYC